MHVVVVAPVLFGTVKGGGERYITESVKAITRHGIDTTTLIVTRIDRYRLAEADGSTRPLRFKEANQIVQKADVVHVHQLNSHGFDYAAAACSYYRKPLVLTDLGGGWRNIGRIFGRKRLRFVDGGAFITNWSAQDVDPKHRIPYWRVVSGGGDHLPAAEPWKERFDFGFVGRILPHKGLHVIVESLPIGARLVIAGQARDPAYMSEIEARAAGKNVTFLLDADDHVVAGLYKSIRYLLVPSVSHYRNRRFTRPELLGFVALEALSAGTPVIGSDVAGLGEVLRAAKQQVLPPGDIKAWHDGLTQAMKQEPWEVRTGEFKWNAVAARLVSLFQDLLQDNKASS